MFLKVGWAILLSVMLTMLTSFASDSFCVEANITAMRVAGGIHSGTDNKDIYCNGIKDKLDPDSHHILNFHISNFAHFKLKLWGF